MGHDQEFTNAFRRIIKTWSVDELNAAPTPHELSDLDGVSLGHQSVTNSQFRTSHRVDKLQKSQK